MPSNQYAGLSVFGIGVHMKTSIAAREIQFNAYPGVNGLESLDMGGRGRTTQVTGTLTGATINDLIAAKTQLESFNDGTPRVFYDSAGFGWRNVLMGAPEFEASGYRNGGTAFFWSYGVVLVHLSQT